MQAVIGSIAAQEVVKACSGKFTPLNQWFYFDSLESLEEDFQTFPEEVVTATGSRYDGQVAVFGANLQKVLENWRVFVVRRVLMTIIVDFDDFDDFGAVESVLFSELQFRDATCTYTLVRYLKGCCY